MKSIIVHSEQDLGIRMLVPIAKIKIPRDRPYKESYRDIDPVLIESIKAIGVLNPIVLNKSYVIIDGLRRYLVAKELGLKELECRIIKGL
jgi:ParB family transcriptional regulator, chromosome partitioning protein